MVLHQLKLNLVASCNFTWREAHNKMLLCHLIALENLKKTQPPIDEDQKLALLHVPFTGRLQAEILIFQIGEEAFLEGAVARAEDRAGPRQMPL